MFEEFIKRVNHPEPPKETVIGFDRNNLFDKDGSVIIPKRSEEDVLRS